MLHLFIHSASCLTQLEESFEKCQRHKSRFLRPNLRMDKISLFLFSACRRGQVAGVGPYWYVTKLQGLCRGKPLRWFTLMSFASQSAALWMCYHCTLDWSKQALNTLLSGRGRTLDVQTKKSIGLIEDREAIAGEERGVEPIQAGLHADSPLR